MKPIHPSKTVFISAGIGGWYNIGTDRLKGSLIAHGCDADIQIWRDEWPPGGFPRDCVYVVKAAAVEYALKMGYTTIIWADASVTARKNVAPFLAHIAEHGYWIGQSGYRVSATATDAQLAYFGVDRDWAHTISDCATGLFGFDVSRPGMREIVETWIKAGREGGFNGPRNHGGGSQDRRYRHGRQDQSAMSIILGKHGVELRHCLDFYRFAWDKQDTTFHCEGM